MIRHRVFIALVGSLALLLGVLLGQGRRAAAAHDREAVPALQAVVSGLGLTDLSLRTEARYTRHPSQTDLFSPFQEFPSALEHFPAGSILAPPQHLGGLAGRGR